MNDKILVIGASGPIASELVSQLSQAQMPVLAAVQTQEEADQIRLPNVELTQISYDLPDALLGNFADVSKIFLALPVQETHLSSARKILEAARKGKRKHFVYLSSFLVHPTQKNPLARIQDEVEKLIMTSGMPYTVLRPRVLMQSFTDHAKPVNGRLMLPYGKSRVSFVDARDVACVAAEVLTSSGHEGKIYHITGGEALTAKEVASHLSRATGKVISYHDTDAEKLRQFLFAANHPKWRIDDWMGQHTACRDGLASSITGVIQHVLGRKPIHFDHFAKDYAAQI